MDKDRLNIPDVPDWNRDNKFNYEDTFLDHTDFDNLNDKLINIGISLQNVNKKLAIHEKERAKIDVTYKRAYREALVNANPKTESLRKVYAEIACEDLELKKLYLDQIIGELTRVGFALRTELEIVQTVGHNIRREMTL